MQGLTIDVEKKCFMNMQTLFPELEQPETRRENFIEYVNQCAGCLCETCINNGDMSIEYKLDKEESAIAEYCRGCDGCSGWDNKSGSRDLSVRCCSKYIPAAAYIRKKNMAAERRAEMMRKRFAVLEGGKKQCPR